MPPLRGEACGDGCRVWISVLVIAKPTYDLKSLSSPPPFGMQRARRTGGSTLGSREKKARGRDGPARCFKPHPCTPSIEESPSDETTTTLCI